MEEQESQNNDTPSRSVARMSQEERLKYMGPVYARRLRETVGIMQAYLERGEGNSHEITKRMKVLEELCTMVEHDLHRVAAEYSIQHGIRNSLLQGGGGFPSLLGAHLDYVTTVFSRRSAEMKEIIYHRRFSAYKKDDRKAKLSENDTEALRAEDQTETEWIEDEPESGGSETDEETKEY